MNLISKESNVYPLITTPNNAYYLNIYKSTADGDEKWQIVEGTEGNTYTLTYEPYKTPKTYQFSLGDKKFYGIGNYRDTIRRSSGKNLFDEKTKLPASRVINGITYTNNGDGTFNVSGTATTGFFVFNISVSSLLEKGKKYGLYSSKEYNNPNFNYTIAFTGNSTRYVIANANPGEYDEQKTEAKLSLWVDNGVTLNATNVRTMIYESDTIDTDYEPYGVGNWYKVGKIGEVQLTGSENWEGGEVETGIYRYQITLADAINIASRQNALTEYTHFSLTGEVGTGFIYSKIFYFYPDRDKTNAILFKAWLTEHNTPLLYPLATPTIDIITGTLAEQLEEWWNGQSLDGTTIIEGSGDLPMLINVRALKGA